MLARLIGGVHSSLLRREGRAFTRAAESQRARALPGKHTAFSVGDGDNGVVERRLNVHQTVGNALALLLLKLLLFALFLRCCCSAGRGSCCCCRFCHFLAASS